MSTRTETKLEEIAVAFDLIKPGRRLTVRRTHAGRHQRSLGAFGWYAVTVGGDYPQVVFGSQWPAGECIKAFREKRLVYFLPTRGGDLELIPEREEVDTEVWTCYN